MCNGGLLGANNPIIDATLWYVLAAANALSGDSGLIAGTQLKVPEVGVAKNDASTFKPYNPSDIVGSTTPGLPYIPPASSNQCAIVAMVVVMVVATVFTAGAATAGFSAGLQAIMTTGLSLVTGGFGVGAMAIYGGLGAFAGSIASQAVGKALGVVDKISLRQAVGSGLTAVFTAGIAGKLGFVSDLINSSSWGRVAASAALTSVGSYAANKAAMVPNTSFSWKSVAASAVTSVIAGGVNKGLGTVYEKINGINAIAGQTVGSMVSGTVNLHVRRQFGFDDKVDYGTMAADAFGNALGNAIVGRAISGAAGRASNRTGSDWRKAAEIRMRQVAAEKEIQRLGYAETIYLDGNANADGNNINGTGISRRSEFASLTASERRRLAEVAVYDNVHLNPVTQREQNYRNTVMSFRIVEDSKLLPIPVASSLPVYSPLVSGYSIRSASIESNRQSAISQWNNSKIPGVAVTGRVLANAGYNIISGANSLGSILTDPAHAENVATAISFAAHNPGKVYDGLVSRTSDMFDRSWQENLETAAVFGIETLATAGTGLIVRRVDGALGLVDEAVASSAKPLAYDISKWGEYGLPSDGYFVRSLTREQYVAMKNGFDVDFGGMNIGPYSPLDTNLKSLGYVDQGYPNGMGFMGSAVQMRDITTRAGYMDATQLDYAPKYLVEFQLKDPTGLYNTLQAPYSLFEDGGFTRGTTFSEFNYLNLNSKEILNPILRKLK